MLKKDVVDYVIANVDRVSSCVIERVYGVAMGVGYDMTVTVHFKEGHVMPIKVHATRSSWALDGHLRPNNPPYKYTGSCDYYQELVKEYWVDGEGLREWLERLKKHQLKELIEYANLST